MDLRTWFPSRPTPPWTGLFLAVVLGLHTACAARSSPLAHHDLVRQGCPGEPLVLVVGLTSTECNAPPGDNGSLIFTLQAPLPASGTAALLVGDSGSIKAQWCDKDGAQCRTAIHGELRINGVDEGIAVSGGYTLGFADGKSLSGTVGAEWCTKESGCNENPSAPLW